MPKYMIERSMPGAGDFTEEELRGISGRSCEVLRTLPDVQWVEDYVTADKIYCVLIASDEAAVREHAERAGFPADSIARIHRITDPTSAESAVKA